MGVPAHCVRKGQPANEIRQVAVVSRPENPVPMIRHDGVTLHAHRVVLNGLGHDTHESGVVSLLLEERQSCDCPIEEIAKVQAVAKLCRWMSVVPSVAVHSRLLSGNSVMRQFGIPKRLRAGQFASYHCGINH